MLPMTGGYYARILCYSVAQGNYSGRPKRGHMPQETRIPAQNIAVIGNYSPRRCGIATYTTDLCEALASQYSAANVTALAMNDTAEGYAYPARVRFELDQQDLRAYHRAADFVNLAN